MKKTRQFPSLPLMAAASLLLGLSVSLPARAQETTAPYKTAPALTAPAKNWVNGAPTSLEAHKGQVVVLTFWTFGCINCKHALPYWNDWAKRYNGGREVAVLSVHTPETRGERNPASVRRFAAERGLRFPALIDNDNKIWDAYGIQAWPTTLVIDRQGHIRGRWEGELNWNNSHDYERVAQLIEKLRQEKP